MSTINKLILSQRKNKNMSQAELAKKLGYTSPQFVYMLESGKSKFPISNLKRLFQALDLDKKKVMKILLKEYKLKLEQYF